MPETIRIETDDRGVATLRLAMLTKGMVFGQVSK